MLRIILSGFLMMALIGCGGESGDTPSTAIVSWSELNTTSVSSGGAITMRLSTENNASSIIGHSLIENLNIAPANMSPMTTARYIHTSEVINGKIYVMGGWNGSVALNSVEVYDPATNSWTTLASMSAARYIHTSEVINGKIYAMGGHNGSVALNSVEVYDPATNSWTTLASMSTARYIHTSVVSNGKIYVMGGRNGSAYFNSVEVYDPFIVAADVAATQLAAGKYEIIFNDLNSSVQALSYSVDGTRMDFYEITVE